MSWRLLWRPGCELCEDFALALRTHGQAFELVDVDTDPEWRRRYGHRIPVLLDAQGFLLMEGVFAPERLPGAHKG
jgi:glutathione S-transferase